MTTTSNRQKREAASRKAISRMSPEAYTALRDAYYKAAEGLSRLEYELQQAALDAESRHTPSPAADSLCSDDERLFSNEMRHATEARKALAKSYLGQIL